MKSPTIICTICGKEKRHYSNKKICNWCYRRYKWKPKKKICPRCKRLKVLHAKNLCSGCYQTTYFLQHNKDWNHQKRHNISPETYKKITARCIVCGFSKYVHLHHLDHNRHNNSEDNMVGLCPNHHQMLHTLKYREEVLLQIRKALREKERPLRIFEKREEQPRASRPLTEINNDYIQLPESIKTLVTESS